MNHSEETNKKQLKLSQRLALENKTATKIVYKPRDPNFRPKASAPLVKEKPHPQRKVESEKKYSPPSNRTDRNKAQFHSNIHPKNKLETKSPNKSNSHQNTHTAAQKYTKQSRFVASEILNAIYEGHSLSECFEPLTKELKEQDQRFVQYLLYGALREYEALNDQLNQLMSKPIKNAEKIVHGMLILALFETINMRTKDHACVNLWVETMKQQKKIWAVGLTNGILRTVLRQGAPKVNTHLGERNLPKWLWSKFVQDFPNHAQAMTVFYTQHPVMTLRVNLSQITRKDYLKRLTNANINATPHQSIATAISLLTPVPVTNLPFFEQGMCSIQDASAQYAAILLNPKKNEYILDACAAPGGKTAHLLEIESDINLVALDISATRLKRVTANLDRIFPQKMPQVNLIAQDILKYFPKDEIKDENQQFDAILLDVPCSGTGILHRHPDIKRLRLASDIPALILLQSQILAHCWDLLKSGGRLLYTTCSVLKDENERQMKNFFEHHKNAIEIPIITEFGIQQLHGLQILPTAQNTTTDSSLKIPNHNHANIMDGFYYCLIQKQ